MEKSIKNRPDALGGEKNLTTKEFTLTLHFVSCRLPSWLTEIFDEVLHPEMQALYKMKEIVEGDYIVGIMFNTREPVEIGRKIKRMSPNEVKVSHLSKNFYLYMPKKEARIFRIPRMKGDAKIKCKLEGDWLKLYYPKENWGKTFEATGFFR